MFSSWTGRSRIALLDRSARSLTKNYIARYQKNNKSVDFEGQYPLCGHVAALKLVEDLMDHGAELRKDLADAM